MPTRCNCQTNKCGGVLVANHVAAAHKRSDLLKKTVLLQNHFKRSSKLIVPSAQLDHGPVSQTLREQLPLISPDVAFQDPPRRSDCAVKQEMLNHGTITGEDLDIITFGSDLPNLGLNFHSPEALIAAVDHFSAYGAATAAGARPLTSYEAHHLPPDPERRTFEHQMQKIAEELDSNHNFDQHGDTTIEQGLGDNPLDGADDNPNDEADLDGSPEDDNLENEVGNTVLAVQDDKDNPDPFMSLPEFQSADDHDLSRLPPHLLVIYTVISWLHLQFHLPRVACNALLTIFAYTLASILPSIATPLVTLQSSNFILGVNRNIILLPIRPTCLNVFPPAGSIHTQDTCLSCNIDLFLPAETKRGNIRSIKSPVMKFPYLPLSEQIKSILRVPGIEVLLDEWRLKDRSPGKYIDIFDGKICCTALKGPNGKFFFSNLPSEKHGPQGELHIGVNLGIDW